MGVSSIGSGALSMAQSQAQWDAIASIKSTSPFASASSGGAGQASTVASGFDAMLSGYNAQAQLLAAAAAPDAGTTTALLNQLASVQQSTIDLFA